jgi:hypothetical protein
MAFDLSKVNRPARAAARAEHVEPRRSRDQRGSDGRRPQHVAAGGKLLVPTLDDALCLGARGGIGNLPLGSCGNVEAPRAHAHCSIIGRIAEQSKARSSYHRPARARFIAGLSGFLTLIQSR